MKGQIILIATPRGPAMAEVWLWAPLLDMAVATRLDMEGGTTGQDIFFRASAVKPRFHIKDAA